MFRSLLSAAAIFAILFVMFAAPIRVSARRCGEKPPETLLSLYRNSDTIYAARYQKTEDAEITNETEDYTVVNIKKHFDISSTFKGESRKMFVVDEEEYRYRNVPEAAAEEVETESGDTGHDGEEEAEELSDEDIESAENFELKTGDFVLLFLKKDDDGKTVPTDYRDGIKKVSEKNFPSYEARIRDLTAIFNAKKVSDEAIVDWLIRCIDDPVTRWEGAFELLQSFQNLDWETEQAKENNESETSDEETGEAEEAVDTAVYARLLSDTQKHALTNILLNRSSDTDAPKIKSLSEGDRVLIELVQRWGDSRTAEFLVEQLRNSSDMPYQQHQMMNSISDILDDLQLRTLADKYGEIYYEDDAKVVEKTETAENLETKPDETGVVNQPSQTEIVDVAALEGEIESTEAETDEVEADVPKFTYKRLRDETMSKFLARADKLLAKKDADAVEAR